MSNTKQRKHTVFNDIDSDEDFGRRSHSSSVRNIQKPLSKEKKQLIRKNIEEEIEMSVNTYPQSASEAKEYLKALDTLESKYYQKYPTAEGDYLHSIIIEHRGDALSALKHYAKKEAREQKQHEREEQELKRAEYESDGNDSEDD